MKKWKCILLVVLMLLLAVLPAAAAADDDAENVTRKCTLDAGEYRYAATRILDDKLKSYQIFDPHTGFSVLWEDNVPAAWLCLQWLELPDGVTVSLYDGAGALLDEVALAANPETVFELPAEARKATVTAGDVEMKVCQLRVFSHGVLPEPYHHWRELPENLDYLLLSTHPDDDVLYLGSVIPIYGADRGYVNGDEWRTRLHLSPVGLKEYKILENYIPYDMSSKQKKLIQGGE